MKKTVEHELALIRNEREKLVQKESEADLKLADLKTLKVSLERKTDSEIANYKTKVETNIQAKKLQLEEEEHRLKLDRERFIHSEKGKMQLEKENLELQEKYDEIQKKYDTELKDYQYIREKGKLPPLTII